MILRVEDYQIDLKLENIIEEDDRFLFTAVSITKDFVCEDGRERLASDSPGKHLVWRHEHPLIPKYNSTHIYGRVLESEAKDGGIFSKYEVYGHTNEHLKVREVIKKRFELGEPINISMRFRQYGEENPIHFDVVEHSLTPTPACKECKAIEILNESDNMEDKEKLAKEIKELEKQLTKKDELLESLEAKVVDATKQVEDKILELEGKDKELEEVGKSKKEITEQLLEFKDKLNDQTVMIEKLQEDNVMKGVQPLIESLLELDGKEMESIYLMKIKEAYKKSKLENDEKIFESCLEFLEKRAKSLESKAHAVITSLEDTATAAQLKDEKLEDDVTKKARDRQAFANMPDSFFEKRGGK